MATRPSFTTYADHEFDTSPAIAAQVPGLAWEPPLPVRVRRAAALAVCARADGVEDARVLLASLGLDEL